MGERATREEVLAWMAATGRGAKAAGTHFAISHNTIKGWRRWARRTGWTPPTAPPTPPSVHPPSNKSTNDPKVPLTSHAPASPASRETTPAARTAPPSHPPDHPRGSPPPSARDIPHDDRALLRSAVRAQLRSLADADTPAFEAQAAAVTLKILLGACPDILAFDGATAAPGEAADNAPDPGEAADAVADAMGLEEKP